MARIPARFYSCAFTIVILLAGCGRAPQTETPLVTPTVTLTRSDAAIGVPIEMSYRFAVAATAPAFTEGASTLAA